MQTKIEYDVIKCWLNLKDAFVKNNTFYTAMSFQ